MAQLAITIPNAVVPRIRAAFAAEGYSATLPDGSANPETIDQFVQRLTREWIRRKVAAYERHNAEATAGPAAEAQALTDIALT